jgi:hypothetical protein
MTDQTEKQIETDILNYLRRVGGFRCFKFHQTTAKLNRTRSKHEWNGVSDIIGWVSINGKAIFMAVEVKKPGGKVSAKQQAFLDLLNMDGGIGFVAYSVLDVEKKFKEYEIMSRREPMHH